MPCIPNRPPGEGDVRLRLDVDSLRQKIERHTAPWELPASDLPEPAV
jgi:hypothetical protein